MTDRTLVDAIDTGGADLTKASTYMAGVPHDAFARLHRFFEHDVRLYNDGKPFECDGSKYASVEDGRVGIAFIAAAVESNGKDGEWVKMG